MKTLALAVAVISATARAQPPRQVYVTIDTKNDDVELQRLAGVSHGYVAGYQATVVAMERICKAPCNETVEVSDVSDFYLAGEGVVGGGKVDLFGKGDAVNIKVTGGSRGRRMGGLWGVVGGAAGIVAGGTFGLLGLMMGDYDGSSKGMFVGSGAAFAGVGLVALIVGILLLPGSGSDISVERGGNTSYPAAASRSM
jgi:hypothetical protein